MNHAGHVAVGTVTGLALAATAHWTPWQAAAATLIAPMFAAGPLSPDVDQFHAWKIADRWIPDELLGAGGPMQHRGITHWWGLGIGWVALWGVVPAGWRWLVLVAATGWLSHLVADFVVGAASPYRPAGIPLAPWGWHRGVGCRCGGLVERLLTVLVLPGLWIWLALSVVGVVRAPLGG